MVNCKNKVGNDITQIILGEDGIVYGGSNLIQPTLSIGLECCNNLRYSFNQVDGNCYWSEINEIGDINIFLNSDNNDGSEFNFSPNDECDLIISFDYLIYISCEDLIECNITKNMLEDLRVNFKLESIKDGNHSLVDTKPIFGSNDIYTYLKDKTDSGLYLDGTSPLCNGYKNGLLNLLNQNQNVPLTLNVLNSKWVNFSQTYSDVEFLSELNGSKIRIGLNILNFPCGFSIKIDNVKINKNCVTLERVTTVFDENPSFNISKVIDNKKTWLNTDSERTHDLKYRETNYSATHDKLIMNSKEMDLFFSVSNAIEYDLWMFIKRNPSLINNISVDSINIGSLLNIDFNSINNLPEFITLLQESLIDVKSLKTMSAYPLLKLVYYRYVNSFVYSGVNSNKFGYSDMLRIIDQLDNYWLELVEQFIPSTTIWGSTNRISNSAWDSQKFKYKKGNLLINKIGYSSSTLGFDPNVSITETDLGSNSSVTYSGVYTTQMNDGSEFSSNVSILGSNSNNYGPLTLSEFYGDPGCFLLTEAGEFLIQENGSKIIVDC